MCRYLLKLKLFVFFVFAVLEMLKLGAKDTGFYGSAQPECFMTDDCDAEKAAIQSVFPKSKRLLCQFHVLQVII